ncbi:DUF4236 domain-containing protein [Corynebacterium pseudopelargi]|uniref:DUF4236 domain-containing protein n=1 Tax=Corynebacterium pseudopelargi TaxID=2080757 RepID=A0A3G6IWI9_9CORY|nr:DUF4236 domain-containing protein [Corynebacterium pseudopelargi]AZA08460.1 hypothetical protein CPPEL_01565 [Corynebacterium pseudopelargi]
MFFSFRKILRPTSRSRIIVSRSGISYSYRLGPVRYTRNANGSRTKTIHTPVKGLTYRRTRRR